MQTFEKVLEIFRDYLTLDLEEEVLKCSRGYLRVAWNGDSRYCADGVLCRTPEELFELLLSDYRTYEEIRLTGDGGKSPGMMKNRRKFSAGSFGNDGRRNLNESIILHAEAAVKNCYGPGVPDVDPASLDLRRACVCFRAGAGAYQYGRCLFRRCIAGGGSPAKRDYRPGNSVFDFPLRPAYGSVLAIGQGAGAEICD